MLAHLDAVLDDSAFAVEGAGGLQMEPEDGQFSDADDDDEADEDA